MKSFGIKPIQKWVFSKPGTEWNGMKLTFQENKKPGMEKNGMKQKQMEWIINVNLFVGYAKITISTLHLLFKWYYSVI